MRTAPSVLPFPFEDIEELLKGGGLFGTTMTSTIEVEEATRALDVVNVQKTMTQPTEALLSELHVGLAVPDGERTNDMMMHMTSTEDAGACVEGLFNDGSGLTLSNNREMMMTSAEGHVSTETLLRTHIEGHRWARNLRDDRNDDEVQRDASYPFSGRPYRLGRVVQDSGDSACRITRTEAVDEPSHHSQSCTSSKIASRRNSDEMDMNNNSFSFMS